MKKILIIDDTPEILENMALLLEMEGYEIITANNGHEAYDKLYIYKPDLIITDLRMPKMDGFSLIEKVKATEGLNAIPILVFSANTTPQNEQKVLQLGAIGFLNKPCPTEILLDVIQGILPPP